MLEFDGFMPDYAVLYSLNCRGLSHTQPPCTLDSYRNVKHLVPQGPQVLSMTTTPSPSPALPSSRHLVRLVLASFLLTFITARILTFLIMTRRVPDLYLHLGGTHVHHLNYGIFLLGGVGAYLLLAPPAQRALPAAAITYGIGLALTFDEFGMWLHLGGGYWQRASLDAVIVLAALLGLAAWEPSHLRSAHGSFVMPPSVRSSWLAPWCSTGCW
jgi:hypothetical protein